MYNAVSIEHIFAVLFGDPIGLRRDIYDADIFRDGDPKALGRLIELSAKWLEERLDNISFAPEESLNAGAKTRLVVAIKGLKEHGATLRESTKEYPNDPHWSIIGELMLCIISLMDHIEGKGAGLEK